MLDSYFGSATLCEFVIYFSYRVRRVINIVRLYQSRKEMIILSKINYIAFLFAKKGAYSFDIRRDRHRSFAQIQGGMRSGRGQRDQDKSVYRARSRVERIEPLYQAQIGSSGLDRFLGMWGLWRGCRNIGVTGFALFGTLLSITLVAYPLSHSPSLLLCFDLAFLRLLTLRHHA